VRAAIALNLGRHSSNTCVPISFSRKGKRKTSERGENAAPYFAATASRSSLSAGITCTAAP